MIQVYDGDGLRRMDTRYALQVLSEYDEQDIMQGEIDLDFQTMSEAEIKEAIRQKLGKSRIHFNANLGVGEPWPHILQVYGAWSLNR